MNSRLEVHRIKNYHVEADSRVGSSSIARQNQLPNMLKAGQHD